MDHQLRETLQMVSESTFGIYNKFQDLRTHKATLASELDFLIQCRNKDVIPRFIDQITNHRVHGYHMSKCQTRYKQALLRSAIKDTRAKLASCDLKLYRLHSELVYTCPKHIWDHIDVITHMRAMRICQDKTHTLEKKFRELCRKRQDSQEILPPTHEEKSLQNIPTEANDFGIVNTTNKPIDKMITETLALGQNFALPPKYPEFINNLICSLEFGMKLFIKEEHQDVCRSKLSDQIMEWKCRNGQADSRQTLILKEYLNTDVFIIPADKGNKTVIIAKEDYYEKLDELLQDKLTYSPCIRDPTSKVVNAVKKAVNECRTISPDDKDKLICGNPILPRLYANPKVHKVDMPLRPIISNVKAMTQPIAKYVLSKVKEMKSNCTYTVENSLDFIDKLKKIQLSPDDLLVSFDVVSLFTNIPIKEALDTLDEYLRRFYSSSMNALERSDIISLTYTCLNNNYFRTENSFYHQKTGLAMGSPISPLLADMVLDKLEKEHILAHPTLKPKLWCRYLDDTLAIWTQGLKKLEEFLVYLNSIHPSIHFTMEIEKENRIAFLDVQIQKINGTLETSVYRKPTAICRPPHATSSHPFHQLHGTWMGLVHRARQLCSTPSLLQEELRFLSSLATHRGYSGNLIYNINKKINNKEDIHTTTTLTSQKRTDRKFLTISYIPGLSYKLQRILKTQDITCVYKPQKQLKTVCAGYKPKPDNKELSGVYKITCKGCSDIYIGQTQNCFKERLYHHQYHCGIRKTKHDPRKCILDTQKSAAAAHMKFTNHEINWADAQLFAPCEKRFLDPLELIHIWKNRHHTMNRKEENALPEAWKQLLHP